MGTGCSTIKPKQELGDVEFRKLASPVSALENHSGLYLRYAESDLAAGDPNNLSNHFIVELLGDPINRINLNSLGVFANASPTYYGAFALPARLLTRPERAAIEEVGLRLLGRSPAVEYIGPPVVAAVSYLNFDDVNHDEEMQEEEIVAFRSDAFVEYCYAKAVGVGPIVDGSVIGLLSFSA